MKSGEVSNVRFQSIRPARNLGTYYLLNLQLTNMGFVGLGHQTPAVIGGVWQVDSCSWRIIYVPTCIKTWRTIFWSSLCLPNLTFFLEPRISLEKKGRRNIKD